MQEGLELLGIGMTTVFAFLLLLVGCMTLAGKFFEKYDHIFSDPEPEPAQSPTRSVSNSDAEVAVALAAAYRAKK